VLPATQFFTGAGSVPTPMIHGAAPFWKSPFTNKPLLNAGGVPPPPLPEPVPYSLKSSI
jgi:hypothetical protein